MLSVLKSAIEGRRVIRLWYEPGIRLIEPHCLGISSKGDHLLRAFQTEGASASGEHANWKLFRVDRIQMLPEDTGELFAGPRPEYNPDDRAMKGGIIAALPPLLGTAITGTGF
jgi:hypothetical protein